METLFHKRYTVIGEGPMQSYQFILGEYSMDYKSRITKLKHYP